MEASETAISSASQDDRATLSCFLEAQEIAAESLYMNTQPVGECFSAQSESEMP